MLRPRLLLALLAAFSVLPFLSLTASPVQIRSASGATDNVFHTRAGKVTVYLPADMSAGDTISGTVVAEPATTKDPKQQQKNADELNGYVVELEKNRARVGDKTFSWKLPATIASNSLPLFLKDGKGKILGQITVPMAGSSPAPGNFQIPNLVQAGRRIQIQGPFDGNSANTSARLGGAELPVLAESPRQAVLQNSQSTPGVLPIALDENGVTANATTRNIQIDLRAEKLDLRRGETTELKVTVNGLAGLAAKVPILLTNQSPDIVTLAGGNVQTLETSGNSANEKEEFTRTLTGIEPGKYEIKTEMGKFEPIPNIEVQLSRPSPAPSTTTPPPSTQPSPTPPLSGPSSSPATSTVRPTASPASTPPTSPGPSGVPAPSPSPTGTDQTIPNVAVPATPVSAVPMPTPERKENPCCKKIREQNDPGFGTRLVWRQGNDSFELMGPFLFLEVNGVRAQWKFDRNLEEVFCYLDKYEIDSEVKQVSETSLKDGKTTEKQETISLLFTGPDYDNKSTRPHKFFQFMASKLNDNKVKEYAVSVTVDEEKCAWMVQLFGNGTTEEFATQPARTPQEIFDEMIFNLNRTTTGVRPFQHGSWWTNMYRMFGEIQQWLFWLESHPDAQQQAKIDQAYQAWRTNMRFALTDMEANAKNLSQADKQTMLDLGRLLNNERPTGDQLFQIFQKLNSLSEKFQTGVNLLDD